MNKFSGFHPLSIEGWRYVPYELSTNWTWTPANAACAIVYTNKLGVYLLLVYE